MRKHKYYINMNEKYFRALSIFLTFMYTIPKLFIEPLLSLSTTHPIIWYSQGKHLNKTAKFKC